MDIVCKFSIAYIFSFGLGLLFLIVSLTLEEINVTGIVIGVVFIIIFVVLTIVLAASPFFNDTKQEPQKSKEERKKEDKIKKELEKKNNEEIIQKSLDIKDVMMSDIFRHDE